MKKVFALLLTAVMLLGVLTMGVSAAAPVTLNDLIEMARSHGRDTVYLPYDMAINESTVSSGNFAGVRFSFSRKSRFLPKTNIKDKHSVDTQTITVIILLYMSITSPFSESEI